MATSYWPVTQNRKTKATPTCLWFAGCQNLRTIPTLVLLQTFLLLLINPTQASSCNENFIERRRDHCHVNLIWKEMQTLLETDEYFKLYGHSRRSLWKILSNLLHIYGFMDSFGAADVCFG